MVELKDKWALVTGASRSVGKRVAKALAYNDPDTVLPVLLEKEAGSGSLYGAQDYRADS